MFRLKNWLDRRNILFIFLVFLFLALFSYHRLVPILHQSVPYTYDQGRDFLKAREIIHDKNLLFVGPTTGISGIYHGAWWYYFLAIPYFVFSGNPAGFYFFVYLSSLVSAVVFTIFTTKEFGKTAALFFITLVASSTYLVSTAIFAISSVFAIPFLVLLLISSYYFLKTQKNRFHFLIFLALGFIFEAEVALGIFLTLGLLLAVFITRKRKIFFATFQKIGSALIAFLIPTIPRFLFELKNHFPQTNALKQFLFHGKLVVSQSYTNVFWERVKYFWDYYRGVFFDGNVLLAVTSGLILLTFFVKIYHHNKRPMSSVKKNYLFFIIAIIFSTFIMSLFYKDIFWFNYLEGLTYFYLAILVTLVSIIYSAYSRILRSCVMVFFIILLLYSGWAFFKNITQKDSNRQGLLEQVHVVKRIYEMAGKAETCVRIYTPPVIPHTYNYLFTYFSDNKGYVYPTVDYVNDTCYYIIEKDDYAFRIEQFRKDQIPQNAKLIDREQVERNIIIEKWQL